MTRLRPGLFEFQVPLPFPGLAFVFGYLNRQAVAAALGVVADECPMAIAQSDDLRAGAGVGQIGESCTGLQVSPRSRESLWWSRWGAGPLSRMRVKSEPSRRWTMLGWILPAPISGVLVCQVCPQSSVSAMSENEKPSEYKRHDQPRSVQNERMRPSHPAEPAVKFVMGMRPQIAQPVRARFGTVLDERLFLLAMSIFVTASTNS